MLISQKQRACHLVDFAILADHRVKIKESEKIDKYLDLARELRKLWNKRMIVIPVVVSMLELVLKGLQKRLEELEIRGHSRLHHC